jgi:hypothetical protein
LRYSTFRRAGYSRRKHSSKARLSCRLPASSGFRHRRCRTYNGNKSSNSTVEELHPAELNNAWSEWLHPPGSDNTSPETSQPQDPQSLWIHQPDNEFRRACAAGVVENVQQEAGAVPALPSVVQTCECALDALKQGNLSSDTTDSCARRWLHGDFGMPDPKTEMPYLQVYEYYTDPLGYQDALARAKNIEQPASSGLSWFRLLGGGFALICGIISFVSGLLGWLLIMKKRVLQCSVCGATVSAS